MEMFMNGMAFGAGIIVGALGIGGLMVLFGGEA